MTDLVGKTLGQYEIREVIGKGGMATVYKGFQSTTSRDVAIKVLPPQFTHDDTFVKRFQQEARVIAQLEHQSILPIYDFGQEDHTMYIVMRHIDGGTLDDLIRAGSLSYDDMRRVLTQIGGALDYSHERGVIHRDLKPRNILIDKQGNAYLTDFGIAKLIEKTMELTGTGVMGTPAYIAPEVAQGMTPDARADVYALGIVAYEMLTGQVPYDAETPMGVILKHVNDPVPSVRAVAAAVPPVIDEVIQNTLTKNPDKRYQSTSALALAFADAVRTIERGDADRTIPLVDEKIKPPPVTPPDIGRPSAPAPVMSEGIRRRTSLLVIIAAAGAGILACLCAVVVLASRNSAAACQNGPYLATAPQAEDATGQALMLPNANRLYDEDFAVETGDWAYRGVEAPSELWNAGELCLPAGGGTNGRVTAMLGSQNLADFVLEIDVSLLRNTAGNVSMLIRYQDDGNYLALSLLGDAYSFHQVVNGQSRELLQPTPSGALRPAGATNHIRVEATGSVFSFFANGAYLNSVSVSQISEAGRVGIAFEGKEGGAAVDNLAIHRLDTLRLGEFTAEQLPLEREGYAWRAENGQIVGEVSDPEVVVWLPAGIYAADAVIDVETQVVTAPSSASFGLLCRLVDGDNFYEVLIDSNGFYSIWLLQNDEWTALVDWTENDAIRTGDEATNHLRVACVGESIVVNVNGRVVETVQDSTHHSGDVALVIESGTESSARVTFSNFAGFIK